MSRQALLLGVLFWSLASARSLNGQTWNNVGPPGENVSFVAIDPRSNATLYAATDSTDPSGPRLMKTEDGGLHWVRADSGLPPAEAVRRILVRADGSAIYAVAGRALFRSEDASTWRAVHIAESVNVRDVASSLEPDSPIFIATDQGVWRSDDAGNTWSIASSGLSDVDVRTVVVTARMSYASTSSRVFRSTDGRNWTAAGSVPNAVAIRVLAADPLAPSTAYASVDFTGCVRSQCFTLTSLFKSTDAGDSWVDAGLSGTSPFAPVDAALDPTRPFVVYAGFGCRLFRTSDGGATWTDVSADLPLCARPIAVDPSTSRVLAAGPGLYERAFSSANLCLPDPRTLCVYGGRFRVRANWQVPAARGSGEASAVPRTENVGYFWFFTSNNIELAVKIVEGRLVNGKFWIFGAGLTNVEYDLTVVDTQSGTVWTHHNGSGQLESFADVNAF